MLLELWLADLLAAVVWAVEVSGWARVGKVLLKIFVRNGVLATLIRALEDQSCHEFCRQLIRSVFRHFKELLVFRATGWTVLVALRDTVRTDETVWTAGTVVWSYSNKVAD